MSPLTILFLDAGFVVIVTCGKYRNNLEVLIGKALPMIASRNHGALLFWNRNAAHVYT